MKRVGEVINGQLTIEPDELLSIAKTVTDHADKVPVLYADEDGILHTIHDEFTRELVDGIDGEVIVLTGEIFGDVSHEEIPSLAERLTDL